MGSPWHGLSGGERVIVETAAAFAAKRASHFPVDVLREAAELGMPAMCCSEDADGSGPRGDRPGSG